jgi:hypothetical protein
VGYKIHYAVIYILKQWRENVMDNIKMDVKSFKDEIVFVCVKDPVRTAQ